MADKDADPRLFLGDIPLLGVDPLLGEVSPPVVQELADLRTCAAGAEDRLGDINGTLEGTAHKDSGLRSLYGIHRIELAKIVGLKLNTVFLCNVLHTLGRVHTDREDHHVEFFLDHPVLGGGIPYGDVPGDRVLFDDGRVAPEEPDTGEVLRPLVVALEILSVGADIVVEYGTLRICIVVLCQDHLFLGIGAAYGRAVAVAAFDHLPGADTLDPGDVVGMLLVGRAKDLSRVGPGRAEEPLEVHTGDHVPELSVVVFRPYLGVKGLEARRQDDGPDIDLLLLGRLGQIDGVILTDGFADAALLLFQVETALIDVGDERNRLGEIDVDSLVERYLLVVLIRVLDGTVFHADGTARAFVLPDIPGLPGQCYVKVSCFPLYTINFRIGEDLYVGMPADLDQFGCEYSHGAVIGRKGLVELGHVTAYARCRFDQVHLETGSGKIEGGLDAADPSADNHDVSEIILSEIFTQLLNILCNR